MEFLKPSLKITALSSLILASAHAFAQEDPMIEEPSYSKKGSSRWIINLESFSVDSEVAAQEGIDDKAFALNAEWEYFNTETLATSLGIGLIQWDDNEGFSQTTENVWTGDVDDTDSDASAVSLYAEFGHKSFYGQQDNLFLSAEAGVAIITASERSIDNCSNCYSSDIDVSGGVYGNIAAGVQANDAFSLGLHYKHYFSGDLKSAFGIDFIFHF